MTYFVRKTNLKQQKDLPVQQPSASLVPSSLSNRLYQAYMEEVQIVLYDKPYQYMLKRFMDVALTLMSLVVVLPIIIVAAILIKLDSPGPVFFVQQRVGKNGHMFNMYKLRSMVLDAAEQREALESLNEANGIIFKIKADPRITRMGRFIRKFSIDELPQVFNVLKGDMSLVGPRPLPMENVLKFEKYHFNRLKVPQGITGVWQVYGRSDLQDFEEIYNMERHYIETWSLLKDMAYIYKTFAVVLTGKGAC